MQNKTRFQRIQYLSMLIIGGVIIIFTIANYLRFLPDLIFYPVASLLLTLILLIKGMKLLTSISAATLVILLFFGLNSQYIPGLQGP